MVLKIGIYLLRCRKWNLRKPIVCAVFGMVLLMMYYMMAMDSKWITNSSLPLQSQTCTEKHNIVFLKVHKTGSTTIANILQRFGCSRKLNFALPNKTLGQLRYNYFGGIGETLKSEGILPSRPELKTYNILYNHVIFNHKAFLKIFPKNTTVYVTMVRQPVNQFLSALLFFLHEKILDAATNNITYYLQNASAYEPDSPYLSFTNNRQALDLGFSPSKVRNKKYAKRYIKMLDRIFNLVLITEYFDESLIILKRKMCWNFKDILYIRKNKAYKKFDFKMSLDDKILLKEWAMADHLLYEHFYRKFYTTLKKEPSIMEETHYFKIILNKTQNFCNSSSNSSRLMIQESKWNMQFTVTALDCAFMMLGELNFLNKLLHEIPN